MVCQHKIWEGLGWRMCRRQALEGSLYCPRHSEVPVEMWVANHQDGYVEHVRVEPSKVRQGTHYRTFSAAKQSLLTEWRGIVAERERDYYAARLTLKHLRAQQMGHR